MKNAKFAKQALGTALLVMMFGAGSVYAQSSSTYRSSGGSDAQTKSADGKTDANRMGKMSPTGQNDTTSSRATPSDSSGASGTSGSSSSGSDSGMSSSSMSSSGASDAQTKGADGKTDANRMGQMSATGQNDTTSSRTMTNKEKAREMHKSSGSSHHSSGSSGSSKHGKSMSGTDSSAGNTPMPGAPADKTGTTSASPGGSR